MLILVFTRMLQKDERKDDGSVIISLRNFVGEGIIKYTLMIHKYFHCIKFKKQNQIKIETIFTR